MPTWTSSGIVISLATLFVMLLKWASLSLATKHKGVDAMNNNARYSKFVCVPAMLDLLVAIGASLIAKSLPA